MAKIIPFIGLFFFSVLSLQAQVFEEKEGILSVEAEHFAEQSLDQVRNWKIIDEHAEVDPHSWQTASSQTYLKLLPDTRTTHDDPLIRGENFSNEPGKMAVISYSVYFNNPGRYYVWVRAYSTGTEDNGIHVGLDGKWPESGQRMQWCEGKKAWTWASKQRTQANHCGEEKLIYLDLKEKGYHIISFSMREDGFAFDKWVMEKKYQQPDQSGPPESKKIKKNGKI